MPQQSAKAMFRIFRRKSLVICAGLTVSFLVIYFVLYFKLAKRSSSEKEQSIPHMDLELLGLPKPTLKLMKNMPRPTPPFIPQLHVKTLPHPIVTLDMTEAEAEENFFRYLENKNIRCNNDVRLGNEHDGGWNVCLSPPFSLIHPCIVMSFGIGRDWQFDDSVSLIYGCQVLAYDPSIIDMKGKRGKTIEFKRVGIGSKNEVNVAGWHLKSLGTHIRDEGLEGKVINYVKIDIEYSEWEVLKTIFEENSLLNVHQFGIEIHSRELFRGSKIDMPSTKRDFFRMYELLRPLEDKFNFRKFNYRRNPFGDYKSNITGKSRSCCYELHYLNMNFVTDNYTILHDKDSSLFH